MTAGKRGRPARSKLAHVAALIALALPLLGSGASGGRADRHWMGEDALRTEFAGKDLAGIYPSGSRWSELLRRDGTSDYREEPKRKEGRWWLSGSDLCFTYGTPNSGGCFQVLRQSANCYDLYFVEESDAPHDKPRLTERAWNGVLWRTEEPTTCEMPIV